MLLIFEEGMMSKSYLIPSKGWETENGLFRNRDYIGLKSKPEYGLNVSKKNITLLDKYKFNDEILKII